MKKLKRRLRKTAYYSTELFKTLMPKAIFRAQLRGIINNPAMLQDPVNQQRIGYYCKLREPFELPAEARSFDEIPFGRDNTYYFDFVNIWKYLPPQLRSAYQFGDVTNVLEYPRLVKSRPLIESNANDVLLKWDSIRHFYFVGHDQDYRSKKDGIIWRGRAGSNPVRLRALELWSQHPLADIGDVSPELEGQAHYRPFASIPDHCRYKFILSIEGIDVATNLKWIMSSNSLCFMPKPQFETWFMEGLLKAGEHYVELRDDLEDLEEKMKYYLERPDEAETIVRNAHLWVGQFRDSDRERFLQLQVLLRYLQLSSQIDMLSAEVMPI